MDAAGGQAHHRVFREGALREDATDLDFAGLRTFLRSLGLAEQESGGCYLYSVRHPIDGQRHFATVRCTMRQVTVYLYPDALGRDAGHAARLYRTLDLADLGMGSKLGPSIGFSLDGEAKLRLFKEELAALFEPQQ